MLSQLLNTVVFFLGIFRFPFFPKQGHGFKTVSGTTMPKRGSFAPLEIIHGTYKVDRSKKIHYKISLDNVVKKHNVKPPKIQNMIRCILF